MKKHTRKLYNETLKNKWIPLLKRYKKEQDDYFYELRGWIKQRCSFCFDVHSPLYNKDGSIECERCKINPEICSDYGKKGFYSTIHSIIHRDSASDMRKYLKKMIKLLKKEKFKCIFKRK